MNKKRGRPFEIVGTPSVLIQVENFLNLLPLKMELASGQPPSPLTLKVYRRIATEILGAIHGKPVKIKKRSKQLQVFAVKSWLTDLGFLSQTDIIPGIDPKTRNRQSREKSHRKTEITVNKRIYPDEFKELLSNCPKEFKRACRLSYKTGLRLSEVLSVKKKTLKHLGEFWYVRVQGKGNKARMVPVPKSLDRFMTNFQPIRMTSAGIEYQFKKARTVVDRSWTFHCLRHSFASEFMEQVGSVGDLQVILGHEDIETTMIYVHRDLNLQMTRHVLTTEEFYRKN
jgi:integrase